jgi:GAF domain-containing protein
MKAGKFPLQIIKTKNFQELLETRLENDINKRQIEHATLFIKDIEKGNLDAAYGSDETDQQSELLSSLLSMRSQMKLIAEQEFERNWATEGLARFVEILRDNTNEVSKLGDNILRNLIKYLEANQGGLFIVNDHEEQETTIEMVACYAYERKKYIDKVIKVGEGLVGQCYLEQDIIYMNHVPKDYVTITSGLGGATPRNVLLVPLKLNEEVLGVVELASFKEFKPYQIDFIKKLGESIASTIATSKINEKTKRLLEQSQIQAEELRSQEEEVRQNLEELAATQEEMQRVLTEVQDKEAYMTNLINASSDVILTIDKQFKVVLFNKALSENFKAQGVNVSKGMEIFQLEKEPREQVKSKYERVFEGETFQERSDYFGRHYLANYSPLLNNQGLIIGATVFTKDISEDVRLTLKTEELLKIQQEKAREANLNRAVLNALTKDEHIQNGDWDKAVELLTRTMSDRLGNTRASIWSYNPVTGSIVLEKLFERQKNTYSNGGELFKKDLPAYFKAVESEEIINAPDVFSHEALVEFRKGYLDVLNIKSMLDAPYFVDGKLGGVICCENQEETINWSEEHVDFLRSVADIITIAHKSRQSQSLIEEMRQHTEELRAQEEELRQNMEEMQATQEEMQRLTKEIEDVRVVEKQRAEQQIESQKKLMTQYVQKTDEKLKALNHDFQSKESELLKRISELESLLSTKK